MTFLNINNIPHILLAGFAAYTAHQRDLLLPCFKLSSIVFGVALSMLVWNQNKLIYIPDPDPVNFPRKNVIDPGSFKASMPFEQIDLKLSNCKLHGWFIKQKNDSETKKAITMLYFHGNAGNISNRLPLLYQLWKSLNINIIACEYRGYGESTGEPTEAGLKEDSIEFFKYAVEHPLIDSENIVIFGRSLGAAVAIYLTSYLENNSFLDGNEQDNVLPKGLIIENTFLSIRELALVLFPFLSPFNELLKSKYGILQNEWNSRNEINAISMTPVMFISGRQDKLIPKEHMDELYRLHLQAQNRTKSKDNVSKDRVEGKASNEHELPRSVFYKVENGEHNDTPFVAGRSYYSEINAFLSKL